MRTHSRLLLLAVLPLSLEGCHKGPVKLSEARTLPRETQQAFVKVARIVRPLSCLQRFDWGKPDSTCQKLTWDSSTALDRAMAPIGNLSGDTYPKLHEIVVQAVIVVQKTQQLAPYVMSPNSSMPNGTEMRVMDLGRRSVSLFEMIDNAFTVEDPSWDTEAPQEDSKTEAVPAAPPPVAEKTAPKAEPPPPAQPAAPAAATAPEHADPVAAPPPPPKPAAPPTARSLADSVHEVLELLRSGEDDPDRTATVVAKSRPLLAELDQRLRQYRDLPRAEADHAAAEKFAGELDHALGQVRKAANELNRAARQAALPTADTRAQDVFRDANELLDRAATDVRLALQFMPEKG